MCNDDDDDDGDDEDVEFPRIDLTKNLKSMYTQAKWKWKFVVIWSNREKSQKNSKTTRMHQLAFSLSHASRTATEFMSPNRYLRAIIATESISRILTIKQFVANYKYCDYSKICWPRSPFFFLWFSSSLRTTFHWFGWCVCKSVWVCLTRSTDNMRLDIWCDFALALRSLYACTPQWRLWYRRVCIEATAAEWI